MIRVTLGLAALCALAACGNQDGSPSVRVTVDAAPAVTAPVEIVEELAPLTEAVDGKIFAIREVLARDSLNR